MVISRIPIPSPIQTKTMISLRHHQIKKVRSPSENEISWDLGFFRFDFFVFDFLAAKRTIVDLTLRVGIICDLVYNGEFSFFIAPAWKFFAKFLKSVAAVLYVFEQHVISVEFSFWAWVRSCDFGKMCIQWSVLDNQCLLDRKRVG